MHATRSVVDTGNHRHQIELREHGDFVASIARHVIGGVFPPRVSSGECAQPPEIAVLRLVVNARLWPCGGLDPRLGDDASSLPYAAAQVELTKLQEIAAAQGQATTGH